MSEEWPEELVEEDEEYWDMLEECEDICGGDDECIDACMGEGDEEYEEWDE